MVRFSSHKKNQCIFIVVPYFNIEINIYYNLYINIIAVPLCQKERKKDNKTYY